MNSREEYIKGLKISQEEFDQLPIIKTELAAVASRNGQKHNTTNRAENKRNIKTRTSSKARYNRKAAKDRAIKKLAMYGLIGGLAIGSAVGFKIYEGHKEAEAIHEITEGKVSAQELQISEELYDEISNIYNEIDESDLSEKTDSELLEYLGKLSGLELQTLKEKVSTAIGMDASEFKIYDLRDGEQGIRVVKKDPAINIGEIQTIKPEDSIAVIESSKLGNSVQDIIKTREYLDSISDKNINRKVLEEHVQDMNKNLIKSTRNNLVQDKNGKISVISYNEEIEQNKNDDQGR